MYGRAGACANVGFVTFSEKLVSPYALHYVTSVQFHFFFFFQCGNRHKVSFVLSDHKRHFSVDVRSNRRPNDVSFQIYQHVCTRGSVNLRVRSEGVAF